MDMSRMNGATCVKHMLKECVMLSSALRTNGILLCNLILPPREKGLKLRMS